jgi:hypothetical protein
MNSPAPMLTRSPRPLRGVSQPEHDQDEQRLLEQAVVGGAEELGQKRAKALLAHQPARIGVLPHLRPKA